MKSNDWGLIAWTTLTLFLAGIVIAIELYTPDLFINVMGDKIFNALQC